MKPIAIKGQRLKEIYCIRRRLAQVYKEIYQLGYMPLEVPIRHGWFSELVLTTKLERYKNKEAILEVYQIIEKLYWGRTKEEATQKRLKESTKYMLHKNVTTISRRQYNQLSDAAKCLCIPFYYYTEQKKIRLRFYINFPSLVYRVKLTRAYVTHQKKINPALEAVCDLLEQQLLKNAYYALSQKGNAWKDRWGTPTSKKRRQDIKKGLKNLQRYTCKEIIDKEISWERN
ncbi:hypothetical protein ACFSTE_08940 [Aquimarina hainanensis]|uniref:Uncharacterized protein n=1 Tax=Aquimarina hainanensis TaxID=1578017 RepID=A0ABW5N7R8_9FLAO